MRIGLVLGGGGVRGAAWLIGALHGLVAETGWDPATADVVIGTSAGAVVAALTVAGARPWLANEPDRRELLHALREASAFNVELALDNVGPGSLVLAGRAWRDGPWGLTKLVAGLSPKGFVSTAPIVQLIAEYGPSSWPEGRELWLVATDYSTGRRVAFGAAGAPPADPPAAVAASCAIPAFYRPVEIGGRLYIDGGVHSGANLDLAAGAALDLVICANPLSSATPGWGVASPVRSLLHEQLKPQVEAVVRTGCRLLLLEPGKESIRLIGLNPMGRGRNLEIGTAAAVEVRQHLQQPALREDVELLTRRPPGPEPATGIVA